MNENTSFDKSKRQIINPLMDEINRVSEPLLKTAMSEMGFELPLTVRLYNQIRFYEEYGKLKMGTSVASKKTLAEQFGVTEKQITDAYNNLTNRYKLGKWVEHDNPVFRNVRRTWMSNARREQQKKEGDNYYSVIPEVLQRNSSTITAYQLGPEVRPLSESKKKVSEIDIRQVDVVSSDKLTSLLDSIKSSLNTPRTRITSGRVRKLKARLKEFKPDEIERAARNLAKSKWHMGENPGKVKYASVDFLLRNDEQVDKWLNYEVEERLFA